MSDQPESVISPFDASQTKWLSQASAEGLKLLGVEESASEAVVTGAIARWLKNHDAESESLPREFGAISVVWGKLVANALGGSWKWLHLEEADVMAVVAEGRPWAHIPAMYLQELLSCEEPADMAEVLAFAAAPEGAGQPEDEQTLLLFPLGNTPARGFRSPFGETGLHQIA